MNPRVIDNDRVEISAQFAGKEIRGWMYSDDAERRAKMLLAREYVEGWCDGRDVAPLGPIVVAMEGGLVSSVVSPDLRLHGIDVVIVDYDIEGADESELRKVVQHDGESAEALIGEDRIGEATIRVDYLLASTEEDYAEIARANGWECEPDGRWSYEDDTPGLEGATFATAKEVCKYEELI